MNKANLRSILQNILVSFHANRLLFISSAFIPIIAALFFFMPTSGLRNISYLSFFLFSILLIKNRFELKDIFIKFKSIWAVIFLFLIYMTSSVLWSETVEVERLFQKGKLIIFLSMALASSFYLSYKIPKFLDYIKNAYVLAAISSALILIGDYILTYDLTNTFLRLEGMGRAANPVQCSLLYGLSIIAIIFSKFPEKFEFHKTLIIKILMIAPPFIVMLLTQSRGPLLALFLTLVTIFLMNSKNKLKTTFTTLIGVSLLAIPSYVILKDTAFLERKSTGRIEIWQTALSEIPSSAIWGHGIASNKTYTFHDSNGNSNTTSHIHSLYLSTLFQGGIIGFILLISIYGVILKKYISLSSIHQKNLSWLGGWMLMGTLFGLTDFGGIIINLSTEWLVFWWPIGLILGYIAREEKYS